MPYWSCVELFFLIHFTYIYDWMYSMVLNIY
jgi:hypothetical protein